MNPELITYRSASSADYDWALELKASTEGDLIERFFGWDVALQHQLHAEEWEKTKPIIICYNGTRIGTYCLELEKDELFFRRFFIETEFQNRGIGSKVLERVIGNLDQDKADCHLVVFHGNKAIELYLRFGFVKYNQNEQFLFFKRKACLG